MPDYKQGKIYTVRCKTDDTYYVCIHTYTHIHTHTDKHTHTSAFLSQGVGCVEARACDEAPQRLTQILESQCPRIFTIKCNYAEDFRECVPSRCLRRSSRGSQCCTRGRRPMVGAARPARTRAGLFRVGWTFPAGLRAAFAPWPLRHYLRRSRQERSPGSQSAKRGRRCCRQVSRWSTNDQ
jgi:hypothetical protein